MNLHITCDIVGYEEVRDLQSIKSEDGTIERLEVTGKRSYLDLRLPNHAILRVQMEPVEFESKVIPLLAAPKSLSDLARQLENDLGGAKDAHDWTVEAFERGIRG